MINFDKLAMLAVRIQRSCSRLIRTTDKLAMLAVRIQRSCS